MTSAELAAVITATATGLSVVIHAIGGAWVNVIRAKRGESPVQLRPVQPPATPQQTKGPTP